MNRFKILSEASVASGVRRIEALTGEAAVTHAQKTSRALHHASRMLKTHPDSVLERMEKVLADQKSLEKELSQLKAKLRSGVVVLGSVAEDKVLLVAGVTADLTKRFQAGSIVKNVAALVGGGGGGRPDMAQAGGSKPECLDEALASVYDLIQKG